jgi:hypothetical protein
MQSTSKSNSTLKSGISQVELSVEVFWTQFLLHILDLPYRIYVTKTPDTAL